MQYEVSEKELRLKQLRLVVTLMTLIFLFILVYTIIWTVDYNKYCKDFIRTEAEVVEYKNVDGKQKEVIQYEVDGNVLNLTTEYDAKNAIGEIITIYYDKNNPLYGVVFELDSRRIVLPILATAFGCVCAGLIVVYIIICKSNIIKETHVQKSLKKKKNKKN